MKYSIVIPIYNSEKHLKELFEDIKDNFKSIDEYEIICVEDCSTDNSFKLLNEIAVNDSRVKIIKNYKNLGQGTSILNGINEASGEFIITIDDYWSISFINNHSIITSFGNLFNSFIYIILNWSNQILPFNFL